MVRSALRGLSPALVVDLGRRDVPVPEQFLHFADVLAVAAQVLTIRSQILLIGMDIASVRADCAAVLSNPTAVYLDIAPRARFPPNDLSAGD